MDNSYTRVAELDDQAKPHRRVYRCPATGLYVKLHAKRVAGQKFGRLSWSIQGALCDATGKALTDAAGAPLIHMREHRFSVSSDRPADGDMVEAMRADFERECLFIVARVEAAALKMRAAETL